MRFEWDPEKAKENFRKHGVTFDEAQFVFLDFFARDELDSENSTISETRFIRLGLVFPNILLVVYTIKDENTDTYRIISARKAGRKEEKNSIGQKDNKTKPREAILEVTQEDYERMKAQGIDDESLLKPGKHIFRRVRPDQVATLADLHPSNTKVQITMKIDLDILNHFKARSKTAHAAPYQTQINSELREIMERDVAGEKSDVGSTADKLLNDDEFLKKLSKKIKRN